MKIHFKKMNGLDLPSMLQRQIALYTPAAGLKLQKGDRFLGDQRGISNAMRNCICALCVSTDPQPHATCTLLDSDEPRRVRRQQTELCKSICLSRGGMSMLQRLIRGLLKKIGSRCKSADAHIRVSLQKDAPSEPYIYIYIYIYLRLMSSMVNV